MNLTRNSSTLSLVRASLARVALAMLACASLTSTARAQLGFTELALTGDPFATDLNSDLWIASAAPADVDGDGDLDLLVAGYFVDYVGALVEDRLTLYRNDGPAGPNAWTLTAIPVDASGLFLSAGDIAWGDYDGDGDPDAVVASRFATTLFRNDAGTLVRTTTVLPGYEESPDFLTMDQRSLTWADVDNDGDLDLLLPCVFENFSWQPTALLRNDGPGAGGDWTFTNAGQELPQALNAQTAWADMDADGDLDLMFGEMGQNSTPFLDLWRNDAGTFVRADSGLAQIVHGTADWADADGDGDIDVVVGGNLLRPDETGETVVRVLYRHPGGWTPVDVVHEFQSAAEPWLDFECVTWADYDSDGDVDLLITGQLLGNGEIVGGAEVYVNSGGAFTLAGAPLPGPNFGNTGGAFTWFDLDGDGDLDYFVAGGYYVPGGNGLIEGRGQLFRNDATNSNAAPSAPFALAAAPTGNDVTLSWGAASDDDTPGPSLTYELAVHPVGGVEAATGVVSAPKLLPEHGNVSRNTSWTVHGLGAGDYEWSVRALDNAFEGGPAATGTFTIAGTTDVAGSSAPAFGFAAPHPNPFSGSSRLSLSLPNARHVTLAVYDVQGHRVARLHDGRLDAGVHAFELDARGLASGLYFVRATAGTESRVRKLTVLD